MPAPTCWPYCYAMQTVKFPSLEALLDAVEADKRVVGSSAFAANRYPLRFVLLDTFEQCAALVERLTDRDGTVQKSVGSWLAEGYPDTMLTYTELAERIENYVHSLAPGTDSVITPFSELARFYDAAHFDSLLRTLKGIEARPQAGAAAQRIYIPIVGMEGKLARLLPDSQLTLWQLRYGEAPAARRMVLCRDTFGLRNLESRHAVVHSLDEWLRAWHDYDAASARTIISTSEALYANAGFAQPDNAFSFIACPDARTLLCQGLSYDLEPLAGGADDGRWRQLAAAIDTAADFRLADFIAGQFGTNAIGGPDDFIHLWFTHCDDFRRWLLRGWYAANHNDYLSEALGSSDDDNIFVRIALYRTGVPAQTRTRRQLLNYAADHGAHIDTETEATLAAQLEALAAKSGAAAVAPYLTRLTRTERRLAADWTGQGLIATADIAESFPDLEAYLRPTPATAPQWTREYIDAYKQAKLRDKPTPEVEAKAAELCGDEVHINKWLNTLSTTRTLLQGRHDIVAYYWIDGLGLDWLPFIAWRLELRGLRIAEAFTARALLPTTTAANREELQALSPDDIWQWKTGDLDSLAHRTGVPFPDKLLEELDTMARAIDRIAQSAGSRRVAIVSDHGLTYLSQHYDGLALGSIDTHHSGRCGHATAPLTADSRYVRLDDGTVCATGHRSLTAKTPRGLGAHGGCTPEEVLVPVVVVEPATAAGSATWQAELLTRSLAIGQTNVRWHITGLPIAASIDARYDGRNYRLRQCDQDGTWACGPLALRAGAETIELSACGQTRQYHISFTAAAVEDDPFAI